MNYGESVARMEIIAGFKSKKKEEEVFKRCTTKV